MRGNNKETAQAYFNGTPEGESYTGNLSFRDGKLYSYAMCIAVKVPGVGFLLRDRRESPSITTSQHMGNAYAASHPYAPNQRHSVHFDLLDHAGIEFDDVQDVDGALGHNGYTVKTDKGYMTYMRVTHAETMTIQTPKDVPSVFWTRNKPRSVEHLTWSMLPKDLWPAAYEGRVYRVGDLFFVLEPDFDGETRDERYVDDVARVGYDHQSVGVLRRDVDNPEMCTGQVRIDGASFMPDREVSDWYHIVPSQLPSISLQRRFTQKAATEDLIEWPIHPHSPEKTS